jgi:hypothetical protein
MKTKSEMTPTDLSGHFFCVGWGLAVVLILNKSDETSGTAVVDFAIGQRSVEKCQ